jgi:hypothetical protein
MGGQVVVRSAGESIFLGRTGFQQGKGNNKQKG